MQKNKAKEKKELFYRAPLRTESDIINQIAILLKNLGDKQEAVKLYEWVVETFERSFIKTKYRYHSYGVLLANLAKEKALDSISKKVLHYELSCGKAGTLGYNYMTLACAMIDDSSNREICRQMIKEVYYLLELSTDFVDQRVVKKFFAEKYGCSIG